MLDNHRLKGTFVHFLLVTDLITTVRELLHSKRLKLKIMSTKSTEIGMHDIKTFLEKMSLFVAEGCHFTCMGKKR